MTVVLAADHMVLGAPDKACGDGACHLLTPSPGLW